MKKAKYLFIYNPKSGQKRWLIGGSRRVDLGQVKQLLEQYQLPFDSAPTKYAGHATKLARNAVENGYTHVLVAGGDGTIGEAANGLVGSDVILGILPLGSFMNVARMLSIPPDIEKAVEIIKIGRVRKIDVGVVTHISGKQLPQPYYFLESIGIGLWAHLHQSVVLLETGKRWMFTTIIQTIFGYYHTPTTLSIDGKEIKTKAMLVNVANGPYSSASLKIAPQAKLNDHVLTISLYNMSTLELMQHMYYLFHSGKHWRKHVSTHQGKQVHIETKGERLVHVDGRKFGKTPISLHSKPNALTVICGFAPSQEESSLREWTYLES
jgi:diacylglycerol kinase (ATP)